ncbi:MAG TPA: antitoxin Xre/MbcA/ParS toxin-binding domain-containing protein [Woeseiaceae bacterium]|jgi:putative toxin-antitoxin system antitoxin component (TIGR02293 family)|nr:antitoxin Xre/MbcA/ParS toxin-binding domain-containing protein [Woeseiaceae bacterium]
MSARTAQSEASRIARFLGLRGWPTMNDVRLVERVAGGLPVSTAFALVRQIDPQGERLQVEDIIPRASYYRRKAQRKPLSKQQSEAVFALSKVFAETLRQYHDDKESALLFLSRKHPLLGGRSPLDVARESTAGADLVLKLLARAEAGIAA